MPSATSSANSATVEVSRATRYQLHAASTSIAEDAGRSHVAIRCRERKDATTLPSSSAAQATSSAISQADAATL
jgi:hypothetical protein